MTTIRPHLNGALALGLLVVWFGAVPLQAAPIWMIDPGHGGDDVGVVGCDGLSEAQLTLEIAQRLQRLASGAKVYISRATDANRGPQERATLANQQPIDLWLSLHADAAPDPQVSGIRVYINHLDPQIVMQQGASELQYLRTVERVALQWAADSDRLAYELEAALTATLADTKVTRIRGGFMPLMGVDAPTVMIGLGFLTNPADCAKLRDPVYLERLAVTLVAALARFKPMSSGRVSGRRGGGR